MATIRPTLSEVVEQILADAAARLPGVEVRLQRSLVDVLLLSQAGGLHGAYGFLQQIADDVMVDRSRAEWLDRHASLWGITRGPATYAQGWAGAAGTFPVGVEIPVGTILRRSDGREYATQIAGIAVGGAGVFVGPNPVSWADIGIVGTGWAVPIRAVESGEDGNALTSTSLSFVSPIAGVSPIVSVVVELAGAVDAELDDQLRERVLARLRNPPQGGTAAEYEAWALAASTSAHPITRVFVRSPAAGSNVVAVYVVNDGGGFPSAQPPTPSATAIANAAAAIDARRPLSADRSVVAPTFVSMAMTIDLTPDTPTTRAAIEKELDAYLFDNHEPGQEVPLSIIQAVVSNAAGGADARITAPTANWTPSPTQLLHRGSVTWT